MKVRTAVVHLTKVENSFSASANIAKFIAKVLNIPIIDTGEKAESATGLKWRVLIAVNGPPAFCMFRDKLDALFRSTKTCVWVQNDYTCYTPTQMKDAILDQDWCPEGSSWIRPPVLWTTIPDKLSAPCDAYIDWNRLSYAPMGRKPRSRHPGLLYYGSKRQGRVDYMRTYLDTGMYPIHFFTSARMKGKNLVSERGNIHVHTRKLDLRNELDQYQATVYMEDTYSHTHFCSLANRFYECLNAGVAQFIDRNALGSFQTAGLSVNHGWLVDGPSDVAVLLPRARRVANQQLLKWQFGDTKAILARQVRQAYKKVEATI